MCGSSVGAGSTGARLGREGVMKAQWIHSEGVVYECMIWSVGMQEENTAHLELVQVDGARLVRVKQLESLT